MRVLLTKFKETFFSIFPILVIVMLLHFTVTPLDGVAFSRFLFGSLIMVIGLTFFVLGVDIGITPIGNMLGSSVARANKLWLLLIAGLVLGIVVTIAEPSLIILANQIDMVTNGIISSSSIMLSVSLGTGIMCSIGLFRIVYSLKMQYLLLLFYGIVFILGLLAQIDFLGLAFDASGATTGALAVPFILAIASGTSSIKKDSKSAEEDSFGLVGISSIGAILAVLIMGTINKPGEIAADLDVSVKASTGVLAPFIQNLPQQLWEVFIAFLPILIIFVVGNAISFKLNKHRFARVVIGVVFSTLGLVLFLLGVNQGFMEVGSIVGGSLATTDSDFLLILVSFLLGVVTILAEPAVHILTKQIEHVTSGYVKSKLVMATLAIGVGVAVTLAILRVIIPGLQSWHVLLPGFALAIILTFFSPDLFVGIAFDSGGVASGPMTATFVLAFVQGAAAKTPGANVLIDGFGTIAMVAMTPLIALQILGVVYKINTKRVNEVKETLKIEEVIQENIVDETYVKKTNQEEIVEEIKVDSPKSDSETTSEVNVETELPIENNDITMQEEPKND